MSVNKIFFIFLNKEEIYLTKINRMYEQYFNSYTILMNFNKEINFNYLGNK